MEQIINTFTAALITALRDIVAAEVAKALEGRPAGGLTEADVRQLINDNAPQGVMTEERVREIAESEAEEVLSEHTRDYDHDEFLSEIDSSDVEDAVENALSGREITVTL